MRLGRVFVGLFLALGLAAAAVRPTSGQAPSVGCPRAAVSTTTVTRELGPSLAAQPVINRLAFLANGLTAFFPELVEVTTVTNFAGIEGLTRVTVHSTINTDQITLRIPEWLVRAYGGDIPRLVNDVESGRLRDVGPCA